MSFNYESSRRSEVDETSEAEVNNEQLSETEEVDDNYDDCALDEARDGGDYKTSAQELEDAEDDYEDCELKVENMEQEHPELEEDDDDDYSDCDKSSDRYVAEVTYTTDGSISEVEADEELKEAYHECDDPEDMQELKENANESEHIEVKDAELVEKPENGEADELTEEEYEAAQEELDEAEEELKEAEENIEESEEKLEESQETEEKSEQTEEIQESEETEEADEDVDEDTPEVDEIGSEDEEDDDEGSEGTENIDSESDEDDEPEKLDEMGDEEEIEASDLDKKDVSQKVSERVEDKTETELSDETKEQIEEETSEEIDAKADGETISKEEINEIVDEKAQEHSEDIEEQSQNIDEKIENNAEEAAYDDELTEEEAQEQVAENVKAETVEENAETEDELADEQVEQMVEEKSEAIEQTLEDEKEDKENAEAVEEIANEMDENQAERKAEKADKSLSDRLDDLIKNENATPEEIENLREESDAQLQSMMDEKNKIEDERKEKFNRVCELKKGTPEYQKALEEHNDLQDKSAKLSEQIVKMKTQQVMLDRKKQNLREAQIEKGSRAINDSATTLKEADKLQERYEDNYYESNPDKEKLKSIRDDSRTTILDLNSEKQSIKQAMDAKMDEIAEYVSSNNMSRYDTSHDARYQRMSAEYAAMKESYDKVNYTILRLDENNKAMTEEIGDSYVSMAEMPPVSEVAEVNEGADVPGETDYFIDETEARETLSAFRQDSWEKLSVQEQKQAVAKLANYNAKILGVQDKPRIVYYNVEDPTDFGGYSAQKNTIYINEFNMNDATETADTISHEYRHKYQHERAEKLENERDLEFKEGFDNYIRPEDDYRGYKDQLVEADARAYAQVIKDKINSYSEEADGPEMTYTKREGFEDSNAEENPEKGAVFEKVDVEDLPEDFRKKDVDEYQERLTPKEIEEIKAIVGPHYENGKEIAQDVEEFKTYKEHHDYINGHIEKVRSKSLEAADTLSEHFKENDYGGLYSPNIDRRTLEITALYHDTGMDGNLSPEEFKKAKEEYNNNPENRRKYVEKYLKNAKKEAAVQGTIFDINDATIRANKDFEENGFGKTIRPNHSLESAIHALRDRENISKYGANADQVALNCLLHSKSNSGLKNIHSEKDWHKAVERLEKRVNEFNKTHPNEQIKFDSSFLINEDGKFNQEKLKEMRSEALALRIGDANGHDSKSKTSQNGTTLEFDLNDYERHKLKYSKETIEKIAKANPEGRLDEVRGSKVYVDGKEITEMDDKSGLSRAFALGEGNFKSMSYEIVDNTPCEVIELENSDAYPLSTQFCIEERIQELNTAKIEEDKIPERLPGMTDEQYEEKKKELVNLTPKINTKVIINLPNASKLSQASYQRFAANIKRKYDIDVEVR